MENQTTVTKIEENISVIDALRIEADIAHLGEAVIDKRKEVLLKALSNILAELTNE